jgi:uncharacterized iron-regulated protein
VNVNDFKIPPGDFPHPPLHTSRYKSEALAWSEDLCKLKVTLEHEVRDFVIDYASREDTERSRYILDARRRKSSTSIQNYRFITAVELVACLWCAQAVKRINRTAPAFTSVVVVENELVAYGLEFIITCSGTHSGLEQELKRTCITCQTRRDRRLLPRLKEHLDAQKLHKAKRDLMA